MNAEVVDPVTGEISQTPAPQKAPDKSIRSFAVVLSNLENGAFNAKLSEALKDLVGDMSNHQAAYGGRSVPGKISIDLNLKLEDGILEIAAEHKVTKPKTKRGRSLFWVTPENNLTQENPKQRNFDFGGNTRSINS